MIEWNFLPNNIEIWKWRENVALGHRILIESTKRIKAYKKDLNWFKNGSWVRKTLFFQEKPWTTKTKKTPSNFDFKHQRKIKMKEPFHFFLVQPASSVFRLCFPHPSHHTTYVFLTLQSFFFTTYRRYDATYDRYEIRDENETENLNLVSSFASQQSQCYQFGR